MNGSAIHNKNKLLKISNALRAYNETQDELTATGGTEGWRESPEGSLHGRSFHEFYLGEPIVGESIRLPVMKYLKPGMATSCRNGQQPIMSLAGVRIRMWKGLSVQILRGKACR